MGWTSWVARARKKEETAAGEKAGGRAPTECERKRCLPFQESVVLLFQVIRNLLFARGWLFPLTILAHLKFIVLKYLIRKVITHLI